MTIRVVQLGTPRGVPKAKYGSRDFYDDWSPELAPSEALVGVALGVEDARAWRAFVKRYRAEIKRPPATRLLVLLAALSQSTPFSVGCDCPDENRCHRSVLKALLQEQGSRVIMAP